MQLRRHLLIERGEHVSGWAETQRRVGHAGHVAPPRDLNLQVRRHARLQLQVVVRDVDDRSVGRHVLDHDRLQPDLLDRALKFFGRVRVDVKRDALSRPDSPDVGLVDVRVHLHLRQVGGDYEQCRRLHAGSDRLPDVHAALNDDAIDRSRDHRVIEIHLRLIEVRLRLRDRGLRGNEHGLRRVDGDLRGIEIALRQETSRRQFLGPRVFLLRVDERDLVVLDVGFRLCEIRARLFDRGLEERRVEAGDHLAFVDDGVEVGAEPRDVAGYLAADLHRRHGLQRARCADGVDDLAARDRRGVHRDVGVLVLDVVRARAGADDADDREDGDRALHTAYQWSIALQQSVVRCRRRWC